MSKTVEELEAEIKNLQERLEAAQEERRKKSFPVVGKFYSHTDEESNMEDAEKLGFVRHSPEFENYCGTGYEIAFDVLIYEDGTVHATHVNGVALIHEVEI